MPTDETLVADTDASLASDDSYPSDDGWAPGGEDVPWPDEAGELLDVEQLPQHRVVIYLGRKNNMRQPHPTGPSMSEFQQGPSP